MHACSWRAALREGITDPVLEVKREGTWILQHQRAPQTPSPTICVPCAEVRKGTPGGVRWGRLGQTREPGSTPSPPALGSKTSGYNFVVTCQWATKFIFHLSSIHNVLWVYLTLTATWDWSEELVTCWQDIRTLGALQGYSAQWTKNGLYLKNARTTS